MNFLKTFSAVVLLVLAFAFTTVAQTPQNSISFVATSSQSSTSAIDPETFGGEVELQVGLGDSKFAFNNQANFTVDEEGFDAGHQFTNTAVLRFYPTEHVFIGGGARFGDTGDVFDNSFTVNPAITGGFNFNLGRVNFEPYALVLTDDLKNADKSRSYGGGLKVKVPFNDRVGLKLQANAARNSYKTLLGDRVEADVFGAGAGLYITF